MRKNLVLLVIMFVLATLWPSFTTRSAGLSSPKATINISPPSIPYIPVCTNFTINITLADAGPDFRGFEINLLYATSIIEFVDAKDGGDFNFASDSFNYTANVAADRLCLSGADAAKRPEKGTLATIEFHCSGPGDSELKLQSARLWDRLGGSINYTLGPPCSYKQVDILEETWEVYENLTLCHNYGFIAQTLFDIRADNIVLDLNKTSIVSNAKTGTAVQVEDRSNVCVRDGDIMSFQHGLIIKKCNNVNITNMGISTSDLTGIDIYDSNNINIVNSTVERTGKWAIGIHGSSNIGIVNLKVKNSTGSCGLGLYDSHGIVIVNSTLSDNMAEGIYLEDCTYVKVSNSEISHNQYGIAAKDSNNTTVCNSTISDNTFGIHLERTVNDIVHSNNFFRSKKKHAICLSTESTKWNLDYPLGGNYWDDYSNQSIKDDLSGKKCTIPEPDGIGDQPYLIEANNKDEYPLRHLYNETLHIFESKCRVSCGDKQETKNLACFVYSDAHISDFDFNRADRRISLSVSTGTFCVIIVDKELLGGPLKVFANGNLTNSVLHWDDTHIFAAFPFNNETYSVIVEGELAARLIGDITGGPDGMPDGRINILDFTYLAKRWNWEVLP